jgi:hypothetical protein
MGEVEPHDVAVGSWCHQAVLLLREKRLPTVIIPRPGLQSAKSYWLMVFGQYFGIRCMSRAYSAVHSVDRKFTDTC